MKTIPSRDILRWSPSRWEDLIGNRRIKRYLTRMVRHLRSALEGEDIELFNRVPTLLEGASRSGKTAASRLVVRCLACQQFDEEQLVPCKGTCANCVHCPDIYGHDGLFAVATSQRHRPVHFVILDCTKILNEFELRNKLAELRDTFAYQGLLVVYADEVHRLVKRGMDQLLLKEIETRPFLWILSTAKPELLEDMLKNRCVTLRTESPNMDEFVSWLARRCEEFCLTYENEALIRLAEKSNQLPGIALQALALASMDSGGLTMELVEDVWCSTV